MTKLTIKKKQQILLQAANDYAMDIIEDGDSEAQLTLSIPGEPDYHLIIGDKVLFTQDEIKGE